MSVENEECAKKFVSVLSVIDQVESTDVDAVPCCAMQWASEALRYHRAIQHIYASTSSSSNPLPRSAELSRVVSQNGLGKPECPAFASKFLKYDVSRIWRGLGISSK